MYHADVSADTILGRSTLSSRYSFITVTQNIGNPDLTLSLQNNTSSVDRTCTLKPINAHGIFFFFALV